jgi:hypothetical protein
MLSSTERYKRWAQKYPEKVKERNKQYRETHPEESKAAHTKWRKKNPEQRKAAKLKQYWPHLTGKQAGLEYEKLLAIQNGECNGCSINQKNMKKAFAVDHCHKTGKIRGLLCDHCNLCLGHAKDDANILKRLANYLEDV